MTNVTGRDHHIISAALAYAIEAIDRLPPHLQAASDRDDMERLLDHLLSDKVAKTYRWVARAKLTGDDTLPDFLLPPASGKSEPK